MLLHRVDVDEIARVLADPGIVVTMLFGDDDDEVVAPDPRQVDIDRLWHGVHWLLTGTVDESPAGLGAVVFGGTDLGELDCEAVRLMRPHEVATVYRALVAVPEGELVARYDPVAMDEAQVYPTALWGRPDTLMELLLPALRDVVEQYAVAASRGEGLLLTIQ